MITELFLGRKATPADAQKSRRRRTRGQGLVEFALVLPVLLLLIFGIIEFARIFYSWLIITNAVRTGERYAVTGQYMDKRCNITADSNGITTATLARRSSWPFAARPEPGRQQGQRTGLRPVDVDRRNHQTTPRRVCCAAPIPPLR